MEPPVCRSSSIDLPTTRTGPVWSHRAAALFFVLYTPTRVWCACGRGVRSDTLRRARCAGCGTRPTACRLCTVQRVQLQDQDAGGLERAHARAARARLGARARSLYTLFSDSCVDCNLYIVTRDSCVCVCMFHVHLQASTFLFLILLCLEP